MDPLAALLQLILTPKVGATEAHTFLYTVSWLAFIGVVVVAIAYDLPWGQLKRTDRAWSAICVHRLDRIAGLMPTYKGAMIVHARQVREQIQSNDNLWAMVRDLDPLVKSRAAHEYRTMCEQKDAAMSKEMLSIQLGSLILSLQRQS